MDYFGSNISYLLKKNRIIAEDLAKIVDLTDGSISNWRKNVSKPKFKEIVILLKHFDISFEELFFIDLENSNQIENLNELNEPPPQYEKGKKPESKEEKELSEKRWELAMQEIKVLQQRMEMLEKEVKKKK